MLDGSNDVRMRAQIGLQFADAARDRVEVDVLEAVYEAQFLSGNKRIVRSSLADIKNDGLPSIQLRPADLQRNGHFWMAAAKPGVDRNMTSREGSDFFPSGVAGTVTRTRPHGAWRLISTVCVTGSTISSFRLGNTRRSCVSTRNRPSAMVACPHMVENPPLCVNSVPTCAWPDRTSSVSGRMMGRTCRHAPLARA